MMSVEDRVLDTSQAGQVGQASGALGDAVSLRGVTRLFDGMPAVSQIRLEVSTGETVWLRGPNGSGKSTLLRILATSLSATFGTGTVLGHDLARDRTLIRARTELLGHRLRMYDDLTAAENLTFVCTLFHISRDRILAALDSVGLDEVADVRVRSFSQGMRQRLALARCLMRDPDLVLLDEPYAGLDVDARAIVDTVLQTSRERGRTVLLASHEAPPGHLIDRSVLLEGGRVVATGEGQP
jgi:heme exporter protein A